MVPATGELARAIGRRVGRPGDHSTALAALSLHRRDGPTDPIPCIYPLGLALTAQGEKRVLVGDRIFDYVPGQSLLTAIEVPALAHVTRASAREPYLGLLLRLDARAIALAASAMELPTAEREAARAPVSIASLDPGLIDALRRLVELLDDPAHLPALAPLVQQEVTVRLLTGPHGPRLRQLVMEDSPSHRIARAVAWLRQNFSAVIRIDRLAADANMSPSTFRQHFRELTGMTPLQFQKQLRLQEARQLMLTQNKDAGLAASLVGYQSASQFSREYSRVFGASPLRDVRRMRSDQARIPSERARLASRPGL